MTIFNRVPILRWIVPAAATALVIGGGALLTNSPADASPPLPPRSAAQLLVDVQQASVTGLSGTVVQSSDLGLPSLPGMGIGGGSDSTSLTSLLAGTHTLRLWYAGPQQVRVAVLGSLGESDVIRNGKDLWTWSSKDNSATHRTLDARKLDKGDTGRSGAASGAPGSGVLPTMAGMTPQQAADAALAAISPSTKVTTDGSAEVAGRPAYELVLTPKTTGSLVAGVRIAVDATEHIPLRVQVFATGQATPAVQVAFSAVDFARPDAAQFAFNPPPGATVTEQGTAKPSARDPKDLSTEKSKAAADGTGGPKIVGTGWSTVLVTDAAGGLGALTGRPGPAGPAAPGPSPKEHSAAGALGGILTALPKVSGSWGSGHLLRSKLFSAVITDKGQLAVGAVAPDLLYAALSR